METVALIEIENAYLRRIKLAGDKLAAVIHIDPPAPNMIRKALKEYDETVREKKL